MRSGPPPPIIVQHAAVWSSRRYSTCGRSRKVVSAWADLRERIGQPMCEGIRTGWCGCRIKQCCQARGLRGGLVHDFGPPIEGREGSRSMVTRESKGLACRMGSSTVATTSRAFRGTARAEHLPVYESTWHSTAP
jgi:hypothetical protein